VQDNPPTDEQGEGKVVQLLQPKQPQPEQAAPQKPQQPSKPKANNDDAERKQREKVSNAIFETQASIKKMAASVEAMGKDIAAIRKSLAAQDETITVLAGVVGGNEKARKAELDSLRTAFTSGLQGVKDAHEYSQHMARVFAADPKIGKRAEKLAPKDGQQPATKLANEGWWWKPQVAFSAFLALGVLAGILACSC
jgi:hypothetical protein